MPRQADCVIDVQEGVRLPSGVEAAIILALRRLVDPADPADGLRIDGSLDEGMSTARVYQGLLTYASRRTCGVVVKIDVASRLANELACTSRFKTAPNVAQVLAPADAPDPTGGATWAAIIYVHASEPWPGPLRTLKTVVRGGIGDLERQQPALTLLRRIFGALHAQLHKKDGTSRLRKALELDFYQKRWLSSATLRVDRVDRGTRRLYANTRQGAPDPLVLTLAPDMIEDSDGTVRAIDEGIGEHVALSLAPLYAKGQQYWGHRRGKGEIQIDAPNAVFDEVATWRDDELCCASVSGVLVDTQARAYARVLQRAGLDPEAPSWEFAGRSFLNPLPAMRGNAIRWRASDSDVEAVFSHGDLHSGNLLCAGDDFLFIDFGIAGPDQPRWADAARLLGSLWRDAIAVDLETEAIAEVLARAFDDSKTEDMPPAAMFLRAAFDSAIAAGKPQDRERDRRELWIAVHHFCWVALRWSADEAEAPEYRPRVLAMVLLAAIAAARVEAQAVAVRRASEESVLAETRAMSSLIANRVRREHDGDAALTFKAHLRGMIDQVDDAVFATISGRSQHLSAQYMRLFSPDWGDQDIAEIEALCNRLDRPLTVPEEVVLVDLLLLGCSRTWSDRAFGLLLLMCDSGDEEVMTEALLAVYMVQGRPEAWQSIAQHPRLRARLRRSLSRDEARVVRRQIDGLAISRADYDVELFEAIQARLGTQPIDLAWALRPFRAADHTNEAEEDQLRGAVLKGLEESAGLSEIEKHVIARSIGLLSTTELEGLVVIFAKELLHFKRSGTAVRWKRLHVRIGTLMQLPQIQRLGVLDIKTAARQMSRTLADIVEDEAEFRHKILADLMRGGLHTLRTIHGLCTAVGDAWDSLLANAIETGGCELILEWLRAAIPYSEEARNLRLMLQSAIDELVAQVQATSGSAANQIGGLAKIWRTSPAARLVFSSEVLVALLDDLCDTQNEWDADQMGILAGFMENVRGQMDRAEQLYEQALQADPRHANNLGNFARFLWTERGQMDRAEQLYEQALQADPSDANHLGSFASFMEIVRGQMERAEQLYEQALQAAPRHANNLANFAGFLFCVGRHTRACEVWERVRTIPDRPVPLDLELEFYAFAHIVEERERAGASVEQMLAAGIRSPDFDLSRCVARAVEDGHPEADRVRAFASQIASASHSPVAVAKAVVGDVAESGASAPTTEAEDPESKPSVSQAGGQRGVD